MSLQLPPQISCHIAGMTVQKDTIGCSNTGVYRFTPSSPANRAALYLKVESYGRELETECRNLSWMAKVLPVPQVVEYYTDRKQSYLLITEMPGKMACDDWYAQRPKESVALLAAGLKRLWEVPVRGCPISNTLERKLEVAGANIRNGYVDPSDWEEETTARFPTPEGLLHYLYENKPMEDMAFTHGDYCLPNIFGEGELFCGFIDVGRAGVADRWQDVALCIRSLRHNFPSESLEPLLYKLLGIAPDRNKLDYYILLDELF